MRPLLTACTCARSCLQIAEHAPGTQQWPPCGRNRARSCTFPLHYRATSFCPTVQRRINGAGRIRKSVQRQMHRHKRKNDTMTTRATCRRLEHDSPGKAAAEGARGPRCPARMHTAGVARTSHDRHHFHLRLGEEPRLLVQIDQPLVRPRPCIFAMQQGRSSCCQTRRMSRPPAKKPPSRPHRREHAGPAASRFSRLVARAPSAVASSWSGIWPK